MLLFLGIASNSNEDRDSAIPALIQDGELFREEPGGTYTPLGRVGTGGAKWRRRE